MNEERHEEIMNAISNLSAQFSEMLREFKKRGELLHEADDATLSTNDLIDVLGVSKATLNRLRQRRTIPFRYISANQVVYPYRELVRELMMGRITFKGLSKMDALQRLQAFRETISLHCITPNSPGNQVVDRDLGLHISMADPNLKSEVKAVPFRKPQPSGTETAKISTASKNGKRT